MRWEKREEGGRSGEEWTGWVWCVLGVFPLCVVCVWMSVGERGCEFLFVCNLSGMYGSGLLVLGHSVVVLCCPGEGGV